MQIPVRSHGIDSNLSPSEGVMKQTKNTGHEKFTFKHLTHSLSNKMNGIIWPERKKENKT